MLSHIGRRTAGVNFFFWFSILVRVFSKLLMIMHVLSLAAMVTDSNFSS